MSGTRTGRQTGTAARPAAPRPATGTAGPRPPAPGPQDDGDGLAPVAPLLLTVIIGSTREGRVGDTVGEWFTGQAGRRPELRPDVLDLADFTFPDRYPERPTPQMTRFATAVARSDAFAVVTPEYNRSFPASLKQAIDYAYDEWRAKPVGLVSYGCGSRGRYAADALRPVFTELHTVVVRDSVHLDLMEDAPGPAAHGGVPAGESRGPGAADAPATDAPAADVPSWEHGPGPRCDRAEHAASAMLDQLLWWGLALREARATRPYVS